MKESCIFYDEEKQACKALNRVYCETSEKPCRFYAPTFEKDAARGCLEAVKKDVAEIKRFAENNDFGGDLYIAATANNALDKINYILSEGAKK